MTEQFLQRTQQYDGIYRVPISRPKTTASAASSARASPGSGSATSGRRRTWTSTAPRPEFVADTPTSPPTGCTAFTPAASRSATSATASPPTSSWSSPPTRTASRRRPSISWAGANGQADPGPRQTRAEPVDLRPRTRSLARPVVVPDRGRRVPRRLQHPGLLQHRFDAPAGRLRLRRREPGVRDEHPPPDGRPRHRRRHPLLSKGSGVRSQGSELRRRGADSSPSCIPSPDP